MLDNYNGESFTFAIVVVAANGNAAGKIAMREFPGLSIKEIRRYNKV